jgi:RNA ligase
MTSPLQNQLRKAAVEDLVYERQFGDLYLYVYTQRAVRDRIWNKTTCAARGLILDENGQIVARPFNKFFNLFERPTTEPKNLPKLPFTVEQKLDGSMGTIFFRDGWNIATKGSLGSDQAVYARENLLPRYDFGEIDPKFTVLTEIIYPENQIVVNYKGYCGLRLLAVRNKNTGEEVPAGRLPILAEKMGMDCREAYQFDVGCFSELPMQEGMEGYVVRFQNDFRVKVKNPWYLRIHRALDSKTHKRIIDLVEAGDWRAFWDALPKELQKDFDDLYADIRTAAWDIENRAKDAFDKIPDALKHDKTRKSRKAFALEIHLNVSQELHPIMFSMLDGNTWRHHVFNIIRGKFKK